MIWIRRLHGVNALLGIGIGLYSVFFAKATASAFGISFGGAIGLTEFRAIYGGVVLACGLSFAFTYFGRIDSIAGVWLSAIFYSVVGLTRAAGILLDGPQKLLQFDFITFEALLLLWSLLSLRWLYTHGRIRGRFYPSRNRENR